MNPRVNRRPSIKRLDDVPEYLGPEDWHHPLPIRGITASSYSDKICAFVVNSLRVFVYNIRQKHFVFVKDFAEEFERSNTTLTSVLVHGLDAFAGTSDSRILSFVERLGGEYAPTYLDMEGEDGGSTRSDSSPVQNRPISLFGCNDHGIVYQSGSSYIDFRYRDRHVRIPFGHKVLKHNFDSGRGRLYLVTRQTGEILLLTILDVGYNEAALLVSTKKIPNSEGRVPLEISRNGEVAFEVNRELCISDPFRGIPVAYEILTGARDETRVGQWFCFCGEKEKAVMYRRATISDQFSIGIDARDSRSSAMGQLLVVLNSMIARLEESVYSCLDDEMVEVVSSGGYMHIRIGGAEKDKDCTLIILRYAGDWAGWI